MLRLQLSVLHGVRNRYTPSNSSYSFPPVSSSKKEFPKILGSNPFTFHRFSCLTTFLFTRIPSTFLLKVIALDRYFSNFADFTFSLTNFERRFLFAIFTYFFLLFILGFVL